MALVPTSPNVAFVKRLGFLISLLPPVRWYSRSLCSHFNVNFPLFKVLFVGWFFFFLSRCCTMPVTLFPSAFSLSASLSSHFSLCFSVQISSLPPSFTWTNCCCFCPASFDPFSLTKWLQCCIVLHYSSLVIRGWISWRRRLSQTTTSHIVGTFM